MITVEFVKPHGMYTPGDVAGFEDHEKADALQAAGVARLHGEEAEGEPESKPVPAKSKAKVQPASEGA
ncbi:hypothetical protein [Chromobacterium sphagni]|uniref:Phage protein n=1 Tax=Chromobacterium sphagni TaxID=1903179 RepID=A0ABX3CEE7_9NEIS|nr:hypothetical protein [Chromobacterium sphagni]OHX20503.1 hypothetical protein BI344_08565 [Chromobacterium sphagni]